MEKNFKIEDLLKIAKRENNNKRSYLYVNMIQGKHVPVSPTKSLELFSKMARKLEEDYPTEELMVVGFAETATAIGTAIAYEASNVKYYISTTREELSDAEYLFFTESHSHAMEQKLVVNGLDECLKNVDRIIFAEDEVTTGNTIEKLVNVFQKRFPEQAKKFGIISIVNSMLENRIEQLKSRDISCHYLYKIPQEYQIEKIDSYKFEKLKRAKKIVENDSGIPITINDYWNSRIVSTTDCLRQRVEKFVDDVKKVVNISKNKSKILILGTEEFMFPGMFLGKRLEEQYPKLEMKFHATTRSPIEVSLHEGYPLHSRTILDSLYEKGRKTYLYNLDSYDAVYIITDAAPLNSEGVNTLVESLKDFGNTRIILIKWGENEVNIEEKVENNCD